MDSPQFHHDCDKCVFLGRFTCEMYGECDLYYADHGGMPDTVIARYGNDGPEYTSGMPLVGVVPALTEAFNRAEVQGLVSKARDMRHPGMSIGHQTGEL